MAENPACGCACSCQPDAADTEVPRLTPAWTWRDRLGAIAVRLGIGRMDYRVNPGLYAIGTPDTAAPVLVTANYKLTVDHLRRAMAGHDAWVLVLDTDGVNVWCAAGKGTFGTEELLRRVDAVGLERRVTHRRLILPQLGAVGVAAPVVTQRSPWRVTYGPIRAADLPAYLAAGRAEPAMRHMRFSWLDRLILTPIEMRIQAKHCLALGLIVATTALPRAGLDGLVQRLGPGLALAGLAWILGCLVGPVLLPWLPGRAFAFKGAVLGMLAGLTLAPWAGGPLLTAAMALILTATTSFLLLNFTGCTTFTGQSGVLRELRWALPAQIATLALGLVLAACAPPGA